MAPKVFEGIIKNGKIIPNKSLPRNISDAEVKIIVLPKSKVKSFRGKFFGAFPRGWGDPVKYQRKIRKEWER